MDIFLSKILIPTTDKAKALKFLTFIFDCEVFTDEAGNDYTHLGNTALFFIETNEVLEHSMPFCSFGVSDIDELENIKQKIQFYCYREDIETLPMKDLKDAMQFFDPDGNLWKVEYIQPKVSVKNPSM